MKCVNKFWSNFHNRFRYLLLILRSTISYEICLILKITMERNTMEKFRYGTLNVAHNNVLYPLLAKYVLGQISF